LSQLICGKQGSISATAEGREPGHASPVPGVLSGGMRLKKWKKKAEKRNQAQAEHRRKLLAKLDEKTREMAAREFLKLGLKQ